MHQQPPAIPFLQQMRPNTSQQKISAIPLEFQHLPVEVISKEFTKLNSTYPFRVHYLGPRPHNTLAFHKKYGRQNPACEKQTSQDTPQQTQNRYTLNLQKIVNCSPPGKQQQYKTTIFYRAFQGMNPTLELADEYIFNGAFESGNLDCVIKVQPREFDLFLRVDSNTRGHMGWFFFSIRNGRRRQKITINICNLRKASPLYMQGLKPFIYSRKLFQKEGRQWLQGGENCQFEEAQLRYNIIRQRIGHTSLYKLSFDYEFTQEDDEVFFAYCVPYTYTQLQQDIQSYRSSPYITELTLARSLSGLDIPLLHIADRSSFLDLQERKKAIVITGRVHPAQTNGSHMVRGLIENLLDDSEQSSRLRKEAHIFIVPMLNPDGVVLGNTRTSIAGKDLNRQFIDPDPTLFPECYHMKQFIGRLQRRGFEITFYLDVHGHSRRKNTFLYGPDYQLQHSEYYKCRLLPKLIERLNAAFRYYSCNFFIPEDKKSTARAIMLEQFKVPFVYTVESSIGLYYCPQTMRTLPLQTQHWHQMGSTISKGLAAFNNLLNQFERSSKDRKADREKKKQRSVSSSGSRLHKKYMDDEFEQFIQRKKSTQGVSSIPFQLLKQIKFSSISNPKIGEHQSEPDSDDQDASEDLPSHKLKQFREFISSSKFKFHEGKVKKEIEDDFQIIVPKGIGQPIQSGDLDSLGKVEPSLKKSSEKVISQKVSSSQIRSSHRVTKTIDLDTKRTASKITRQNVLNSRKSIHSVTSSHSQSKHQLLDSRFHKPRYSLATKNLFPLQNKQQVLSLPRSLQVMRRQMKKGRLLISNLEESRAKFLNGGSNKLQVRQNKIERKGPFNPVDPMKVRMIMRSSSAHVADSLVSKFEEERQRNGQYNSLEGLEVDNLAMTIKTYKRR